MKEIRNDKIAIFLISVGFLTTICFPSWWFFGRQAYVERPEPWDNVLIYFQPKWNGWESNGITYLNKIPKKYSHLAYDCNGWWYIKKQVKPKPDNLFNMNDSLEVQFSKLDEYYEWVPISP